MRSFFWLIYLPMLIIVVGCTFFPRPDAQTIEIVEAQMLLDQAILFVSAGDAQRLCGMGGAVLLCEKFLRDVGGIQTAPLHPPRVTGSYILPDTDQTIGGRVLIVEGTDRNGKPYRTEFLVFYAQGRLVPYLPVYWSGITMSRGNTTAPSP